MYTSLHKHIPSSEEEKIIQELVNDIYELETKISTISKNQELSISNQSSSNLETLKSKEDEIENKIKEIKKDSTLKIKNIETEIKNAQKNLENTNKEINKLKNKLTNQFNPLTFHSLLLSKYILNNNVNDFLTNIQINNIITDANESTQKNNELKQVKSDYDLLIKSQTNYNHQIEELNNKIKEIKELLSMMREEKLTVKEELINYISQKESFEEIVKIKLNIIKSKIKNKNKNKTSTYNNIDMDVGTEINNNDLTSSCNGNSNETSVELFPYEINSVDNNKISNYICDGLLELIESSSKNTHTHNTTYANPQLKKKNLMIDVNDSADIYNEENLNNQMNIEQNFSSNSQDQNDFFPIESNIPISSGKEKEPKPYSIRDDLLSNIQTHLSNYQQTQKIHIISSIQSSIDLTNTTPYEFIDSLSNIIINTLLSINYGLNVIHSNDLFNYLVNVFKIFYYDNLIEAKLNFINKEYKMTKKERKKILEKLNNSMNQLLSKNEDLQSKIEELDMSIKLLEEEKEKDKENNISSLTDIEKEYIDICSKGNVLLNNAAEFDECIINLQKNILEIQKEMEENINKNQQEIDEINLQVEKIKNKLEKDKIESNDQIINLRKLIADKYAIIKTQLQIYKSRHGSNLNIYNNFIGSINSSIKSTYVKPSIYQCNANININSPNNPTYMTMYGSSKFNCKENSSNRTNNASLSASKNNNNKNLGLKSSSSYCNVNNNNNNNNDCNMKYNCSNCTDFYVHGKGNSSNCNSINNSTIYDTSSRYQSDSFKNNMRPPKSKCCSTKNTNSKGQIKYFNLDMNGGLNAENNDNFIDNENFNEIYNEDDFEGNQNNNVNMLYNNNKGEYNNFNNTNSTSNNYNKYRNSNYTNYNNRLPINPNELSYESDEEIINTTQPYCKNRRSYSLQNNNNSNSGSGNKNHSLYMDKNKVNELNILSLNSNNNNMPNKATVNSKEKKYSNMSSSKKYSKVNIRKIPKMHQRNNIKSIPVNLSNINSPNISKSVYKNNSINGRTSYSSQRIDKTPKNLDKIGYNNLLNNNSNSITVSNNTSIYWDNANSQQNNNKNIININKININNNEITNYENNQNYKKCNNNVNKISNWEEDKEKLPVSNRQIENLNINLVPPIPLNKKKLKENTLNVSNSNSLSINNEDNLLNNFTFKGNYKSNNASNAGNSNNITISSPCNINISNPHTVNCSKIYKQVNNNLDLSQVLNKIYLLQKKTICFFRNYSKSNHKFNPLSNHEISENVLINHPFNFVKGNIFLSKDLSYINLCSLYPVSNSKKIDVNCVDNTIVNSKIKKIIEIYRAFKKYNGSIDKFASKECFKKLFSDKNDIIKAAFNKFYDFSLLINKNERIEFIISNFDDFKIWINGVALLIKNKDDIFNYLNN